MKISSFHKQQGDLVNFVTEESHIKMIYDLFYVIREKTSTKRVPGALLDDKRTRLLGATFKHIPNAWDINAVIAACRPDYMLYPEKERDPYYNANIIQMYYNGQKLEVIQPFENTIKHHRKTLVIDKEFWDVSNENIILSLQELSKYKYLAFSAPIKLKKLIKNNQILNLFLELDFSPGTVFKFQNNIGSTFSEVKEMYDFIERLKEKNPDVYIGAIPVRAMSCDHWEARAAAVDDLERCLQIMEEAKRRKIHVNLIAPDRREIETPYWYYFEPIEAWSKQFEEKSYIEFMLHSSVERFNLPWYAILNDSMKWSLPNANFLLELLVRKPEWIEKYCVRQWGEKKLELDLVNWDKVNQYKGVKIDE